MICFDMDDLVCGMFRDGDTMAEQVTGGGAWGRTYRFLRTMMVGLLLCLGVSVLYQTWRQDFHILASVSAYYYTPAQAIFVGTLIGLGACMIALRGTTDAEDVILNIGGMFAAVVAVVPSSRGADYEDAVRACRENSGPLLTDKASEGPDCPTVQALAEATQANVENNMVALLALGLLGLIAAAVFYFRARRDARTPAQTFWRGYGAAVLVYLAGVVAFFAYTDWFIRYAHYAAGFGLLVSIFVVAVLNARRRRREQADLARSRSLRRTHYVLIAWLLALVTVVLTPLMFLGLVSLFWLEVAIGALFAAFWLAQTIEQGDSEPRW